MKKILITAAMLAALGTFAVSCQKEEVRNELIEYAYSEHTVIYRIDDKVYHADIPDGDEWYQFLTRMVALAREGHRVSIQLNNTAGQVAATKEKVTFETYDPEEAAAWMEKMTDEGYVVDMYFDEETGLYTLIAVKQ